MNHRSVFLSSCSFFTSLSCWLAGELARQLSSNQISASLCWLTLSSCRLCPRLRLLLLSPICSQHWLVYCVCLDSLQLFSHRCTHTLYTLQLLDETPLGISEPSCPDKIEMRFKTQSHPLCILCQSSSRPENTTRTSDLQQLRSQTY